VKGPGRPLGKREEVGVVGRRVLAGLAQAGQGTLQHGSPHSQSSSLATARGQVTNKLIRSPPELLKAQLCTSRTFLEKGFLINQTETSEIMVLLDQSHVGGRRRQDCQ
jgi:hypothetical protein